MIVINAIIGIIVIAVLMYATYYAGKHIALYIGIIDHTENFKQPIVKLLCIAIGLPILALIGFPILALCGLIIKLSIQVGELVTALIA